MTPRQLVTAASLYQARRRRQLADLTVAIAQAGRAESRHLDAFVRDLAEGL